MQLGQSPVLQQHNSRGYSGLTLKLTRDQAPGTALDKTLLCLGHLGRFQPRAGHGIAESKVQHAFAVLAWPGHLCDRQAGLRTCSLQLPAGLGVLQLWILQQEAALEEAHLPEGLGRSPLCQGCFVDQTGG